MAGQSVNFDFTSTGADRLGADFRKVGGNAELAAKGARALKEALDKQQGTAPKTAAEMTALTRAVRLFGDAEDKAALKALAADAAIRGLGDASQKAGRQAAAGSAGLNLLTGSGGLSGGGLAAVIAAGVALSPVIATLGTGLAGLGAAAVSTVGPILKAGTATKEAQKALASLDPAQKAAYDSLGLLKTQFGGFAKSLEPQVLDIFSAGLRTASGLMHDVQPVAKATGDALGGFLGQIDAEFRSRTWQDFFGFMAKEAGPDMQLVAGAILPLLDTLPKLLTDIQPIAEQFLKAAGGAARLADSAVTLNEKIQHLGTASGQSGGLLGRLADAGKKAVAQMLPGIPAAQALGKWLGVVGGNSDKAGKGTAAAGDAFKGATPHAQMYAQWIAQSAKATTALMDAQSAAVSTQLAYGNDILTSANDAQTFHDKLKASKGMIGLHTQAQRDSFGAANTYIGDLSRQAGEAIASGHGTDAAITAIKNGFPALDTVKTKNKQYWQEVKTLVGQLKALQQIKAIQSLIKVNAEGVLYSNQPGVQKVLHSNMLAGGGLISMGSGPVADDVPAMLSRGELVVPARMVSAGAVDHLRGRLPGFAAGGAVTPSGRYSDGPGGLASWLGVSVPAMGNVLAAKMAVVLATAFAKAVQPAAGSSVPGGGGGAARWSTQILTALAMLNQPGSLLGAVEHRMNQESGGNPFAVNKTDSNWLAGTPSVGVMQVIGPTYASNSPPGWRNLPPMAYGVSEDVLANTYAGLHHAITAYRGRSLASVMLQPGGYARGGLIPGYASGGTVGQQGAAYLHAWRTRHGGPAGAAHGPVVVNEQIARMAAAAGRAKALAGAAGLSPGQHRFWAGAAADETRRLGVLRKELATERAWRFQLGVNELGLDREVRAAGNLPGLAGPVRGWKAQIGRDRATIAGISKMLGYSGAYLAAHKPPPKVTPPGVPGSIPHTGAYTDSTADLIARLFAASASLSRVVTLDSGGWLMPGHLGYNGTSRPEQVLPPGRGGSGGGGGTIVLNNHGVIGSQAQLEDWLVRSLDTLRRKRRL